MTGPVEENRVALGLRRKELEHAARRHGAVRQHLVLDRRDALVEPLRLLVALREEALEISPEPEVLPVEHRRVQVREDVLEREAVEHMALQIGWGGNRLVMADN